MTRMFQRLMVVLLSLALLAGCQTELYGNLTEREANDIIGALLESGIKAAKATTGDQIYTVSVDDGDLQMALNVLQDKGLPRTTRDTIGQVFSKSGIVSSPFEERVRYIYALGEDVSRTIEEIDGVMVARVHIVMPEDAELGQDAKPSSAAIFIKQMAGFDLDFLMPQVRRLVANSIEGVNLEEVTVVLVEAEPTDSGFGARPEVEFVEVLPGIKVSSESVSGIWYIVLASGGILIALLVGLGMLLRSNMKLRRLQAAQENGGD